MDNQNSKIINMQNEHGKTALHFACSEGYEYTAEALLRLGAVIERYVKTCKRSGSPFFQETWYLSQLAENFLQVLQCSLGPRFCSE